METVIEGCEIKVKPSLRIKLIAHAREHGVPSPVQVACNAETLLTTSMMMPLEEVVNILLNAGWSEEDVTRALRLADLYQLHENSKAIETQTATIAAVHISDKPDNANSDRVNYHNDTPHLETREIPVGTKLNDDTVLEGDFRFRVREVGRFCAQISQRYGEIIDASAFCDEDFILALVSEYGTCPPKSGKITKEGVDRAINVTIEKLQGIKDAQIARKYNVSQSYGSVVLRAVARQAARALQGSTPIRGNPQPPKIRTNQKPKIVSQPEVRSIKLPLSIVSPLRFDQDPRQDAAALCAQVDPELFFPEKGGSTKDAKNICKGCEIRSKCLDFALENEERYGVWGGLSERERRRLSKQAG